jgi:hypothetical protein
MGNFSKVKAMYVLILTKMSWATFWAMFSQSNPILNQFPANLMQIDRVSFLDDFWTKSGIQIFPKLSGHTDSKHRTPNPMIVLMTFDESYLTVKKMDVCKY